MQEDEGLDNLHTTERIDWCAFSSGIYNFSGKKFQCGNISNVNHNNKSVTLSNSFTTLPKLLTKCSTYNGSDPVNTRNKEPVLSFTIKLQEDTARDSETNHVNEDVSFIAVE
ncbi:hypothetical protein EB169_08255 [archaeon]|nr:hypothetical protein [archaeon]